MQIPSKFIHVCLSIQIITEMMEGIHFRLLIKQGIYLSSTWGILQLARSQERTEPTKLYLMIFHCYSIANL